MKMCPIWTFTAYCKDLTPDCTLGHCKKAHRTLYIQNGRFRVGDWENGKMVGNFVPFSTSSSSSSCYADQTNIYLQTGHLHLSSPLSVYLLQSTLFLLQHFTDTRGRACEEFHVEICFVPAVREGGMTEEGTWASSTSWQYRRWKPRLNLMLTQSSSSTGGN